MQSKNLYLAFFLDQDDSGGEGDTREGAFMFNESPPIRLTKWVGKVTYILHRTLEAEETHARASKLGLEQFYKRWNRCLTTMPKILSGENIV